MNLTAQGVKEMGQIVGLFLRQERSPYQIFMEHSKLGVFEKTLYNYIESNVFREIAGITVMNLRCQVSCKISKKKSYGYKKKSDRGMPAGMYL